MKKNTSAGFYLALSVFSLIGQVAWVVENMYFNVFIYEMFHASASDISLMVLASAIAAAVTTILMGALSDKVGRRKPFMCFGYILWGISILSFAFIRTDVLTPLAGGIISAASLGVSLTIAMDCVMTFFGSTANDACFNAWLTDSTDGSNRGRAEGINSMMPLVAILAVFGGFMAFDLSKPESWTTIYIIIGVIVSLIGIIGFFIIKEPDIKPVKDNYFKTVIHGFRPSCVKRNGVFYASLLSFALFGISIQIFMPYLILYYTEGLKMSNYVLIMAPAIIMASLFTVIYGRRYDKAKFRKSIGVPLLLLALGYIVLFLFKTTVPVFIGSLLMMSGYLSGGAVFGALMRDYTPAGEAGQFQGPRIVFSVLIPGAVGPMIGAWVLRDAQKVINSDGTESFIPNEKIFITALCALAVAVLSLLLIFRLLGKKKTKLKTVCPDKTDTYPRPMMKRDGFISLDGEWELAISEKETADEYKYKINVPYPEESELSGIGKAHKKGEYLHYKRVFGIVKREGERVLLHLGAADQICDISVNGVPAAHNEGGYLPVDADITELVSDGENTLTVRVRDDLDTGYPYGKQCDKPHGMWYKQFSGIWKSVFIEYVPDKYISGVKITPSLTGFDITVYGGDVEKTVIFDGRRESFTGESAHYEIENPRLWSPESPYLYDAEIISGKDRIKTYFALRTFSVGTFDGIKRLCLNGKPYFFSGVLDQGYFPDGICTPPDMSAYTRDILNMKSLGFNTLRKHIKIEPEAFYCECDRLGMIVFQDAVNNGKYSFVNDTVMPTLGKTTDNAKSTASDKEKSGFSDNALGMIRLLYGHPCIALWTVFNEGWGQHDSEKYYEMFKKEDNTRFVDTASGWFETDKSDVKSVHVYFKPVRLPESDKPVILSEFGGYALMTEGHTMKNGGSYGYKFMKNTDRLNAGIEELYRRDVISNIEKGLCAAIYTQVSDVEDEINGLYTYDRAVCKVDSALMRKLNAECVIK